MQHLFQVIQTISTSAPSKTINGQKAVGTGNNKVKILSNVVMSPAGAGPSNLLLNKSNLQRYLPRQKVIGNGAAPKYITKPPPNNMIKTTLQSAVKNIVNEKTMQRAVYPTHKSQIKTMPPVNSYVQKMSPGIKTLPPQSKNVPGQVQRTNAGLRTIPPQRQLKPPARANYIGKHAIQVSEDKN